MIGQIRISTAGSALFSSQHTTPPRQNLSLSCYKRNLLTAHVPLQIASSRYYFFFFFTALTTFCGLVRPHAIECARTESTSVILRGSLWCVCVSFFWSLIGGFRSGEVGQSRELHDLFSVVWLSTVCRSLSGYWAGFPLYATEFRISVGNCYVFCSLCVINACTWIFLFTKET